MKKERGRHAWESCGRCLKTLKEDNENKLSHFTKTFQVLPFLSFPFPLTPLCPKWVPASITLPCRPPASTLRCLARVTPQHCSVISGSRAASSSEPTERSKQKGRNDPPLPAFLLNKASAPSATEGPPPVCDALLCSSQTTSAPTNACRCRFARCYTPRIWGKKVEHH